jgi:hypothetical protein
VPPVIALLIVPVSILIRPEAGFGSVLLVFFIGVNAALIISHGPSVPPTQGSRHRSIFRNMVTR